MASCGVGTLNIVNGRFAKRYVTRICQALLKDCKTLCDKSVVSQQDERCFIEQTVPCLGLRIERKGISVSRCITDSRPKPYRTSLGRNKVNVGRKTVQKLNELKAAIFESRENIEEDVRKRLVFPGVVIAIHGGMARSTKNNYQTSL